MFSQRIWVLVALVLVSLWAYRACHSDHAPSLESNRRTVLSLSVKSVGEGPEAFATAPTPAHKVQWTREAPARPVGKTLAVESLVDSQQGYSDVANFKVEDGLAIAFGDVILGKPDSGSLKAGRAHVLPPLPWSAAQIPYFIAPEVPEPERILAAIDYFNKNTPVTFVPFNGQADVLVFQPGKGCKSYVGKIGGYQPIYLELKCGTHEVMHELMHALGFVHEQSRVDRDQFLKINWENIDEAHKFNFDIAPESYNKLVPDTGFDYQSIMLYPPHMFAKSPNLNAMESLSGTAINPVTDGLSQGDLIRIEKLLH